MGNRWTHAATTANLPHNKYGPTTPLVDDSSPYAPLPCTSLVDQGSTCRAGNNGARSLLAPNTSTFRTPRQQVRPSSVHVTGALHATRRTVHGFSSRGKRQHLLRDEHYKKKIKTRVSPRPPLPCPLSRLTISTPCGTLCTRPSRPSTSCAGTPCTFSWPAPYVCSRRSQRRSGSSPRTGAHPRR